VRASLIVWGLWLAAFLIIELPAAFGWTPWRTLSETSWNVEQWWEPTRIILEVFLAVLLLHICFKLSAGALIFVTVVAVVTVGVHLVELYA
jgi:hypothetical protein